MFFNQWDPFKNAFKIVLTWNFQDIILVNPFQFWQYSAQSFW